MHSRLPSWVRNRCRSAPFQSFRAVRHACTSRGRGTSLPAPAAPQREARPRSHPSPTKFLPPRFGCHVALTNGISIGWPFRRDIPAQIALWLPLLHSQHATTRPVASLWRTATYQGRCCLKVARDLAGVFARPTVQHDSRFVGARRAGMSRFAFAPLDAWRLDNMGEDRQARLLGETTFEEIVARINGEARLGRVGWNRGRCGDKIGKRRWWVELVTNPGLDPPLAQRARRLSSAVLRRRGDG